MADSTESMRKNGYDSVAGVLGPTGALHALPLANRVKLQ